MWNKKITTQVFLSNIFCLHSRLFSFPLLPVSRPPERLSRPFIAFNTRPMQCRIEKNENRFVKLNLFQTKYECVPGFELVGKDTRYCQSDGTWTPRYQKICCVKLNTWRAPIHTTKTLKCLILNSSELPTCVPVQCTVPDSPHNGKAIFTAVAYKVKHDQSMTTDAKTVFSIAFF